MFQFPGFPSIRYELAYGWQEFFLPGFPIQTSAGHGICAPLRSFSQLITSFFGSQCQGIRPALLPAWPSALHVSMQQRFDSDTFLILCIVGSRKQKLKIVSVYRWNQFSFISWYLRSLISLQCVVFKVHDVFCRTKDIWSFLESMR